MLGCPAFKKDNVKQLQREDYRLNNVYCVQSSWALVEKSNRR